MKEQPKPVSLSRVLTLLTIVECAMVVAAAAGLLLLHLALR